MGNITHGEQHGSILGPALFNIHLNYLPNMPNSSALESFVDDSKLYLSFPVKYACEVMRKIDEDLSKIAAWCCYNSLLINLGKTKMLVVGTRKVLHKLPENFHVTLLGKKITPAISIGDLGVQLDSLPSFDQHIDVTTSTCIAGLCQTNRVKYLFDSETLENVISSLVFSKLYYYIDTEFFE